MLASLCHVPHAWQGEIVLVLSFILLLKACGSSDDSMQCCLLVNSGHTGHVYNVCIAADQDCWSSNLQAAIELPASQREVCLHVNSGIASNRWPEGLCSSFPEASETACNIQTLFNRSVDGALLIACSWGQNANHIWHASTFNVNQSSCGMLFLLYHLFMISVSD